MADDKQSDPQPGGATPDGRQRSRAMIPGKDSSPPAAFKVIATVFQRRQLIFCALPEKTDRKTSEKMD